MSSSTGLSIPELPARSPATCEDKITSIPTPSSPTKEKRDKRPLADNSIQGNPSWIWGFTLNEITNVILQVFGFIIAVVFGAWAIKSYASANIANNISQNSLSESITANELSQISIKQSLLANQLAILGLCQADQFKSLPECSLALEGISLPSIIIAVVPSLTTIKPSVTQSITVIPTTTPPLTGTDKPTTTALPPNGDAAPRQTSIGLGGVIGIIAGTSIFLAIIGLVIVGRRRARTRSIGAPMRPQF
ncbi:hypothetical protein GALMADRAFT_244841 [Galerina marginata CBS 339.88]|uniref:Uncharacterized protein n=1 Tax=Galerina marginata (strain CBS 339.88) TaxID=685588 RepID=A0A067TD99_GALM3|nr:hypothetical protein GALMADRAFT_244841 [Galerina marginata CBS 339.88]